MFLRARWFNGCMSSPLVLSTNIAVVRENAAGTYSHTGIDKAAVESISVSAPGPKYGDGSGVAGDFIGDDKHHGGADKAVYAFSREELDFWAQELGRPLPDGSFGENLTSQGIDLAQLIINQRVRIGTTVLEVSVPRSPCATFAAWLDEKGWVKTFTHRGDCGAYFRVIIPGEISPGDKLIPEEAPAHGVTMAEAFAVKMGGKEKLAKVVNAHCLPGHHHEQLANRLEREKAKASR